MVNDILRSIDKQIEELKNPWPEKAKALARDIYDWCKVNDVWGDNTIYFNKKAWSNSSTWGIENGKCIDDELYEYPCKNPKDYFEYVREPNILSMSFEGDLYYVLNGYISNWELEEEFLALFEKYGLYYEMGHAWNLSAYEI